MADFVAVLRKTIDSLGNNTPEMREKVFDKARATIEAKLMAINPPPPAAVIERQRKALEDAISTLRADYAEPQPSPYGDEDDALENVLAALDHPREAPVLPVAPPVAPLPEAPLSEARVPEVPRPEAPKAALPAQPFPENIGEERLAGESRSRKQPAAPAPETGQRSRLGLVAVLVLLLIAAGGGYFWWSSYSGTPEPVAQAPATDSETEGQGNAATAPSEPEPAITAPAEQATAPETDAGSQASTAGPDKFTQRLLPDGSEVDDGRAGGEPAIGEGSSVAAAVQPPTTPDAAGATTNAETSTPAEADQASEESDGQVTEQTAEQAASGTEPGTANGNAQPAAVTVGQRAIFYEERTSSAEGSAEIGSIAWSLVQETPGGDLPPEPAIRAEATIPGKDLQLRMTIRRNGDQTLPASHIVEMIFLTPDGFGGGGVASVSRIAFKETEQAAGSPLIGIPAKIADGFFLIALSDAPAETQANLGLLENQSWLDIPIVYQSGQRALLSLEKGIPGERVFQEALRAWASAGSN